MALPDLPPKGDLSDWLDAGRTKVDLLAALKATPLYVPERDETATTGQGPQVVRLRGLWCRRCPM